MPVAVALGLVVAGCGASRPVTTTEPPPGRQPSPSVSSGPPRSPAPPVATPSPASGVVADESLLAVLPATVDGLALVPIPEAVPEAAADPTVAAVVDRLAFAVAVDQVSGDQVVVLVAHLRLGGLDAADYRAWRDSFDRGVCERAGGVSGHAELTLSGRPVAVGICAEGVRTYHLLLSDRGLVISAQSLGGRRLGEQLLAAVGS